MLTLPLEMQQYLPSDSITVLKLIALRLSTSTSASHIIWPEKYTSTLPPNSTDPSKIRILPLPPADVIQNLQQFAQCPTQSVLCPHVMNARGKRFPVSTILFWACILELRKVQAAWEYAVSGLQRRREREQGNDIIQKVLDVLSYLRWSDQLQTVTHRINHIVLKAFLTRIGCPTNTSFFFLILFERTSIDVTYSLKIQPSFCFSVPHTMTNNSIPLINITSGCKTEATALLKGIQSLSRQSSIRTITTGLHWCLTLKSRRSPMVIQCMSP
jgi:hypothetical protein